MSGGTTTTAVRFKPGDKVRIVFERVVDQHGDVKLLGSTHFIGIRHLANEEVYDCTVEAADTHAPAPYTEPRDGDKAEAWFVGDVKRVGDGLGFFAEGLFLNTGNLAKAVAEGRVRLVKAAAPQFEAGRIYDVPSLGAKFLYQPDWQPPFLNISGEGDHRRWDLPSDLVPCDVVPREAT